MKYLAMAAVAAGLAIAGGANASTNLLTNGSFETGDFTGWTVTDLTSPTDKVKAGYTLPQVIATDNVARGYPTGAFNEGVPTDNAAGSAPDAGGFAAYFSSDFPAWQLSQTITLGPGSYYVGFDAYVPHNGYSNPYDATFTAQVGSYAWSPVLLKGTAIGEKTWTHYEQLITVAGGSSPTTFTFSAVNYPAVDVLVDKVFISAVPEPVTWGLMVVGFGGLGAILRLNRRRQLVAA